MNRLQHNMLKKDVELQHGKWGFTNGVRNGKRTAEGQKEQLKNVQAVRDKLNKAKDMFSTKNKSKYPDAPKDFKCPIDKNEDGSLTIYPPAMNDLSKRTKNQIKTGDKFSGIGLPPQSIESARAFAYALNQSVLKSDYEMRNEADKYEKSIQKKVDDLVEKTKEMTAPAKQGFVDFMAAHVMNQYNVNLKKNMDKADEAYLNSPNKK